MLFSGIRAKKELEAILLELKVNLANNYKEPAHKARQRLALRTEELFSQGRINRSVRDRYMKIYGYSRRMAQIAAIRSFFLCQSSIKLQKPIFNRKLYKKGIKFGNWKPGMTYKEMNRFVEKFKF